MAGGANDDTYTWDLEEADGGPRRGDIDDLGGDEVRDRTPAPHKGAEPHAGMYNERGRHIAGLERMGASARLDIEHNGSAWVIVGIKAMGTNVTASTFTLTPVATGNMKVSWPAYTLPAQEMKPISICTQSDAWARCTASAAREVTVFTKLFSGPTASNQPFTLWIY